MKRVMNITDVGHMTSDADSGEDKMKKGAIREHKTVYEIADFYTKAFFEDFEKLNILRPEVVEKASDHIPTYIKMIEKMLKDGFSKPEIARYCLQSILAALDGMCGLLLKEYGDLPVLFAGGVMSNSIIREALTKKYGAFFAKPEFSTDNAAGIAILAAMKEGGV